MRVAVIGASGRTGAQVVEQALGHGDDVTAIVRDVSSVTMSHERLRVIAADVRELDTLRNVLPGHDAVLSTVGAKPARRVDLYSVGMSNIMYAMAEFEVPRLVALSAAGTFHRNDPNLSMGYKMMMRVALRGLYDDLERMEQRIMASSLEWVIARPSGLTDGPLTGHYRIGLEGRPLSAASTISRADVAAFMLKAAGIDTWLRKAVTLAY